MATKNIYLLINHESDNDSILVGIFDSFEKTEKQIKLDFYGGSIPKNKTEFEDSVKKKEVKSTSSVFYKGKYIPNYEIRCLPINSELSIAFSCPEIKKKSKVQDPKISELNSIMKEIEKLYQKAQSIVK